jgi:HlyD family secretion protein
MKPQGATAGTRLLAPHPHDRLSPALPSIGAIAAAFFLASFGANSAAPETPSGMAVTVAEAKRGCFSDTLVVMGTIVPRSEVLIRPDREGLQITEILVQGGETVSSAQILARLVPSNDEEGPTIAIHAPVGGIVIAAPAVVGEMASARGEPLFRVAAEGDLEVSADVPATQASRLSAGAEAKVKVAGMDELAGRVRLISTTVDSTTQLGQVRISLEHNSMLRVGAFARAIIEADQSCGVAVPLSALLFGPEGPVVQIIRDNRIETRPVMIGLFAQSNVQIREGLAEGDMIVIRSGAFLREGDRVRPVITTGN